MFKRGKGKKSEFVQDNRRFYMANMSHEIRTPMNAIMGIANMLLGQVKDPEEREYLSDMQTATRNLLMTINSILDYESMLDGNIYKELADDLRMFKDRPLMARAAKAIEELLLIHQLDQSEIVRLRRQIEVLKMSDEEKLEDIREGVREAYRR